MDFQKSISFLNYLSDKYNLKLRVSTAVEESKNIDGFIGGQPIQIKPSSHKSNINVKRIDINIPIVYYTIFKNKDKDISIEISDELDTILKNI